MTPLYQVVLATPDLARQMAPRLREADRLEVLSAAGMTPEAALLHSLSVTPSPRALILGGSPCAMWGVQPIHQAADIGVVWMLGTPELVENPLWFWRMCKAEVARLSSEWVVLLNWIDARYDASLRWARRLGFRLDDPRPYGPRGDLFCCAAIVR
jgi:hypothetical protein